MLNAKLHAPAINRNVVSRKNLLAKLEHARERKLTLVTAPAGYGKTTAVLDWLSKCGLPFAWLSLDARDNDPAAFWRSVCAALESIMPGVSRDAEYVFSSPELMDASVHIHILIDRASEALSDFALALDDLHLITDPSVLAELSQLIDYLPQKMHVLFISRTEPELNLTRHRIKWQAGRLSASDLRFCSEEISRFYAARGYSLPEGDVEKVERYTEGWAAAMVAVAMSMERGDAGDAVTHLSHAARDIAAYLRDEIVSLWEPEKRAFALKTSVLDTLTQDACNAVTSGRNAGAMLTEISRTSGFLFLLNAQSGEYKYHYLFKSLLRTMLGQESPDEVPALYQKAAEFFAQRGQIPDAIEYFLNGGLHRDAFVLLEHRIDDLIHKNDFGRLLGWIDRLPPEYKQTSFKIAVIYALYYAETREYDLSRGWVGRMQALKENYQYAPSPRWRLYAESVCIRVEANLYLREGKLEALFRLLSSVSPDEGKHHKMPEYNDFNTTDVYLYRSPINALTRLVAKVPEGFQALTDSYRNLITKNPGYAPLVAGEYLYESNRIKEALPCLLKAVEEARNAQCPGALVPAMADIARLKRAQGDLFGAFAVLDECDGLLRGFGKPHWLYLLRALRCRLHLDAGDMEAAEQWLSQGKAGLFRELNRVTEFELLVRARVLLAVGRAKDAELLLQRLLAFTGENQRLHSRVETLNLLALLAYRGHSVKAAFAYLGEALDIGLREGYVRSFLDELSPMAALLRAYTQARRKPGGEPVPKECMDFAAGLLRQMRESLLQTAQAHEDVAPDMAARVLELLTPQEKRVLELISCAATNREISDRLGIGLSTVKTHTGNIYSKLGLKNRAQCLKVARELVLF